MSDNDSPTVQDNSLKEYKGSSYSYDYFCNYTDWGHLKEETKVTDSEYQPFRLQKQYADRETGLHYNFFRYYKPDAGRFVNQDPIGVLGVENLYQFALNTQAWIDVLGLAKKGPLGNGNLVRF